MKKYLDNTVTILLQPTEEVCHGLVNSPYFIDAVVLHALSEFFGYTRASVLGLTVKYCTVTNHFSSAMVKEPATIVVTL